MWPHRQSNRSGILFFVLHIPTHCNLRFDVTKPKNRTETQIEKHLCRRGVFAHIAQQIYTSAHTYRRELCWNRRISSSKTWSHSQHCLFASFFLFNFRSFDCISAMQCWSLYPFSQRMQQYDVGRASERKRREEESKSHHQFVNAFARTFTLGHFPVELNSAFIYFKFEKVWLWERARKTQVHKSTSWNDNEQ